MKTRRVYFRHSVKRARLHRLLAAATMLAASACAAFLLQQDAPPQEPAFALPATGDGMRTAPAILRVAAQAGPAARPVYPFSIVPGGVGGRAELVHAVMADKVVAAHYAGFAVEQATLRTLARARAVYVSYRKGNQVYWTAHKVRLAEGEAVLSDGQNDIRARCGNRISDTPRLPVETRGPSEQELDTPVEQAEDGGTLRQASFAPDELDGGGQPYSPDSFPHGAGLLAAAQPQADAGHARSGSLDQLALFDAQDRQALLASLSRQPSGLASGTADGATAKPGVRPPAASAAAGGSGDIVETATGGSGSRGGDPGRGSPGTQPAGGTSQPPPAGPHTGPAPGGMVPAKPHELPEPDSLWLIGVAGAAMLLQRRFRRKR